MFNLIGGAAGGIAGLTAAAKLAGRHNLGLHKGLAGLALGTTAGSYAGSQLGGGVDYVLLPEEERKKIMALELLDAHMAPDDIYAYALGVEHNANNRIMQMENKIRIAQENQREQYQ